MPPDDPSLTAGTPANSPAAAPAAETTTTRSSQTDSGSAAAADSSSRPAAYEGSEPSLLQQTGAKEPPKLEPSAAEKPPAKEAKAEAKPDTKGAEGGEKPAEPAKPAEPKPGDDAAKLAADAKAAADAAAKPDAAKAEPEKPAPVEYKYELPETIKLDDTRKTELHGLLDAFRADPANVQPLVDFHNARMADFAKEVQTHNRNVFNEMRAENRKAIMADPILGGSGYTTTSQAVARMRDLLIPKDMFEPRKFDDGKPRLSVADEFLESTGAGDHPVLWHLLHNAARYLDEPQARELPANPRPPKDIGKPPGKGRLRQMYDHPRSNNGQS